MSGEDTAALTIPGSAHSIAIRLVILYTYAAIVVAPRSLGFLVNTLSDTQRQIECVGLSPYRASDFYIATNGKLLFQFVNSHVPHTKPSWFHNHLADHMLHFV